MTAINLELFQIVMLSGKHCPGHVFNAMFFCHIFGKVVVGHFQESQVGPLSVPALEENQKRNLTRTKHI